MMFKKDKNHIFFSKNNSEFELISKTANVCRVKSSPNEFLICFHTYSLGGTDYTHENITISDWVWIGVTYDGYLGVLTVYTDGDVSIVYYYQITALGLESTVFYLIRAYGPKFLD